eukprot:3731307-Rhodomonas_salina.2
MTAMYTMMTTEEREPSDSFSFGCDAQLEVLPTFNSPTGESAALEWTFSGLQSREGSLFGMLSREQSREHSSGFPCDLSGPATNDSSDSCTDESEAETMTMDFRSWSQDLKELMDEEAPGHDYQPEQASNKRKLEEHEHEEAFPEEREAKRQRTP